MEDKELKLEFIESGRMSDDEMSEIVGGALEKCRTLTECPHGEENKRTCSGYKDCDSAFDKFKCSNYQNFVTGGDLEYIYDIRDNSWHIVK